MSLRLRLLILLSCFFLFLTTFLPAQAQPSSAELRARFDARQKEIDGLWNAKQWDKAVPMLEEMLATPAMMRVPDMRNYIRYNLACGYSRQSKKGQALALLGELVADGGGDPNQMEQDSDFENIRSDPAFKEILAAARKSWEERNRFWDSPALAVPFKEALSEDEKIAGLVRFWSEAKYNFAWFERVPGLDWDAKMIEFLPRVRAAKTTADYYRVLMEFAALLHDAHTNVYPPQQLRDEFWSGPPVYVTLVEGRTVVSRVLDDELTSAGVHRGVELISVDGLSVREYGARFVQRLQSASSPQDLERRTYAYQLLDGPRGSTLRLQFRDESGKTIDVTTTRLAQAELDKRDTTPSRPRLDFHLVDDGRAAYVVLNSFGEGAVVSDFEKAWPEIRKAPALIIDVRRNGGGNSGYGSQILGFLVAKGGDVEAVRTRLYRPAYRAWGNPEDWYDQTWSVNAKPGAGYSGPMVLLTGPGSFSAAEDFAVSFDMLHLGVIIGEPTGGSTGQPLSFRLPGGGTGRVCTLQTRYADGRDFVGNGVQPKVRVTPTLADFRAGKDTVLDAALAYLRTPAPSK